MDIFEQIQAFAYNLLSEPTWENIFVISISLIITILYFRNDKAFDFKMETYKNFIAPLFKMTEPLLYKKISLTELEILLNFIDEHYIYADGELMELVHHCKLKPTFANYKNLCGYIDYLYDRYCITLSLHIRSVFYRLNRKQYKNVFTFILLILMGLAYVFHVPFAFYIMTTLLMYALSASKISTGLFMFLIILLCLFILIWVIKYFITDFRNPWDDYFLK